MIESLVREAIERRVGNPPTLIKSFWDSIEHAVDAELLPKAMQEQKITDFWNAFAENSEINEQDHSENTVKEDSENQSTIVNENTENKKASPEENAEKQREIIDSVKNGETVLNTNQEKGNYGEMVADEEMRNQGYDRISEDIVTDLNESPHKGIDGVYENPDGNPRYIIVDAKYNTAELEKETQDGKQMSETWIDAKLDAAVGKEKADEIRMAMLDGNVGCYEVKVAKGGDVNAPVIFEKLDQNGNKVGKEMNLNA